MSAFHHSYRSRVPSDAATLPWKGVGIPDLQFCCCLLYGRATEVKEGQIVDGSPAEVNAPFLADFISPCLAVNVPNIICKSSLTAVSISLYSTYLMMRRAN